MIMICIQVQTIRSFMTILKCLWYFSAGNNGGGDCNYGAGSPWGTITGGFK